MKVNSSTKKATGRILSLLLTLAMLFSMIPSSIFAQSDDQGTEESQSVSEVDENVYTVVYNPGDFPDYTPEKNGKMENQRVETEENQIIKFKLDENQFKRDGYEFSGWSNTSDGENIEDDPQTEENESVLAFTMKDQTLITNWSFDRDTNEDGVKENFDVSYALKDNQLTLYALWTKTEDPEETDDGEKSDAEDSQNTDDVIDADEKTDSSEEADTVEEISDENDEKNDDISEEVEDGTILQTTADDEDLTDDLGIVIEEEEQETFSEKVSTFFTSLFSTEESYSLATYDDTEDNPSGENSQIETLNLVWLTNNAGEDTLELNPTTNSSLSVSFRLYYSLSGITNYEAGQIQIRIPASLFETRDGKSIGSITFSVPQDPESGALFNYKKVGDEYILTNTKTILAGAAGYFDFQVFGITPSEIKSGSEQGPIQAQMTVSNSAGEELVKTSNSLTSVINTQEKLVSAKKQGTVYEEFPTNWKVTLPEDFDTSQYIYVDWYTYCYISGNQYFSISVEDEIKDGGILLGGTQPTEEGQKVYSGQNYFTGWKSDGNNFYNHIYVAYPIDQFPTDTGKTVTNTVKYTLTNQDTGEVLEQTASASLYYKPIPFKAPAGSFYLYKWGVGENGANKTATSVLNNATGSYSHALNDLSGGTNVDLTYEVVSRAYGYAWTCSPGSDIADPANYCQENVTYTIEDHDVYCDDYTTPLGEEAYRFKSIEVLKPTMYRYGKTSSGSWNFISDSTLQVPELSIYGKTQGGDWVLYGTANWSEGTLTLTGSNNADASGNKLIFPEGEKITSWKAVFKTEAAAVSYPLCPTIELYATQSLQNKAQELLETEDSSTLKVRNDAVMSVTLDDCIL